MRAGAAPVLVPEGFAWGALLFGPLWLARHRAWIPAALALAAETLVFALAADVAATTLALALAIWLGVSGHDLRRWSMHQRGFSLFDIIAARDEADAFGKLLERRPNLAGSFLPPDAA